MASKVKGATIGGAGRVVEVDGCHVGGNVRPENEKKHRQGRRLTENQAGTRRVVVALRERGGRTLTMVFKTETASIDFIKSRVDGATIVHTDEAADWNALHSRFDTKRINHQNAFSLDGACTPCCLVLEMRMPKLTGLELLMRLKQQGSRVPAIIATANGEVTSAVRAMKLGAVEFLEKPVNEELLLEYVQYWIDVNLTELSETSKRAEMDERLATLSPRERQVLQGVLSGLSNKEMARELGISPKAIELYRGKLMTKMAAPSLAGASF